MSSIQKFMFDNAIFDPPLEPLDNEVKPEDKEPVEPETPPPPGVTLEELARARAEAYEQGLEAGKQVHESQAQDAIAQALQHLAQVADYLVKRDDHERQQLERQVLDGTMTLTRRLFPHLAENGTIERLSAFARQTLNDHADEREILIAVPKGSAQPLKDDLKAVLESRGMTDRVKIVEDESLTPTDCRITWADGGANMVIDRIWQAIEQASAQAVATHGLAPSDEPAADESTMDLPEPGPAPVAFTPAESTDEAPKPDFSTLPDWLSQAIADEPSHIIRELGPAATEPLDVENEPSDSDDGPELANDEQGEPLAEAHDATNDENQDVTPDMPEDNAPAIDEASPDTDDPKPGEA